MDGRMEIDLWTRGFGRSDEESVETMMMLCGAGGEQISSGQRQEVNISPAG